MKGKQHSAFRIPHSAFQIIITMEIIETKIKDLLVIKPDVFTDERGYFFESYNKERFAQHGLDMTFVQDNESQSMRGVLW